MGTTLNPCHCGHDGELMGMRHPGGYLSLICPECNRFVEAFTHEGLIEEWNKSAEQEQSE